MTHPQLETHVRRAIDKLYTRDYGLMTLDNSEWSMAHRLAIYLEQEIPGWNVDCEYNRQGPHRDIKKTQNNAAVRPDIILHHRGQVELSHNLLAIEVKKVPSESDFQKLRAYTTTPKDSRIYQYQFSLALSLGEEPQLHWFKAGKELK